jgi:protein-S-isoprenylcysteine O-methyltransferase Ste14
MGVAPDAGRSRLPDLGPHGEGWVVGQFLLLGLLVVAGMPRLAHLLPGTALEWVPVVAGAAALAVAGLVVAAGFRGLGTNLTPMPRPRDDALHVETGIYAAIRHPIYAGLILAAVGWSALTRSLPAAAVAVALAIYLDLKSRREEVWLSEQYATYAAYQRRTRRFVPRVY